MAKEKKEERLEIHIPVKRERKRGWREMHPPIRKVPYLHTDVPGGKEFQTIDGRHIHNLAELASILEQMDDHAFQYHANAAKNDFSSWVKDVMGLSELAETIRHKGRKDTQIEVLKHLLKQMG